MATYRIYFNRKEDYPQVWSIDAGAHASEINVQFIKLRVPVERNGYNSLAVYPEPNAWFEVEGTLRIENGAAIIEPAIE